MIFSRIVRKVRRPLRQWAWSRKKLPFVHTAAKGLRFRLYPPEYIDGEIFSEGVYELYLLRFLAAYFRGQTMLDIGANIGNHALYLNSNFTAVHCFEPNPVTLNRLRDNIALNGALIDVHAVGLGSTTGNLPFRSNDRGNLGGGSFSEVRLPVSDTLPVYRGDEYLAERDVQNIDLIKIDVEGFELEVIAGLAVTIARERPALVFEFDGSINDFGEVRAALLDYDFFTLNGGALRRINPEPGVSYEAIFALHRAVPNAAHASA